MKKYIYTALLAALCGAWGCLPADAPELQGRITDLRIIAEATATPNVYHIYANHMDVNGFWNLGNGITLSGANEVYAEYPFAGDYTVSLTGYSNGGRTNSVSVVIPVVTNNFDLIADPVYELIAGEKNSPEGKTWVMDKELYGNVMLLSYNSTANTYSVTNKALPASLAAKKINNDLRLGTTLYDDEATFYLSAARGMGFGYVNHGTSLVTNTGDDNFMKQVFLKSASWAPGTATGCAGLPLPAGFTGAYNGDWQVECTPPAGMSWNLTRTNGVYHISFPNTSTGQGGFLFFALDWANDYQILSLTENRMIVQKKTLSGATLTAATYRRLVFIKKGTPSGLPAQTPTEALYIPDQN